MEIAIENNVKTYLDWKATYAQRASVNYKLWIERFTQCTEKPIEKAEIGDIAKFKNWLEDKSYQPKTIELAMVVVKNYLGFFKLQGMNCLSPQLVRVPRTLANSYQPITFEEYVLMLATITIDTVWNLQKVVILRMLFETGMRVSELCDLNVTDIDPLKMNTTIETKKSAHMRSIFWSVESHIILKEFLVQRKKLNSTPALFVAQSKTESATKRMTTRTVQRMIKDISAKAGIEKKISPHSFRHGKAHRVLELGGNPKDVQAILGHCDPASSFTYLQWNDKEFATRAKMFL